MFGAAAAAPAAAAGPEIVRGSVSLPAAPVVECDGGVTLALAFDVDFAFTWTYDGDALVRERLHLRARRAGMPATEPVPPRVAAPLRAGRARRLL